MNMNRKFFQLRQMTKNLDETFRDDIDIYQRLLEIKYQPNHEKLENDKQVVKEWEIYKRGHLAQIIDKTLESEGFKICICEFTKKKKITIEFWFKVAYDIFHDEFKGKLIRMKFWKAMRKKASFLEQDLKRRRWPSCWKYLEKEPCLNLEILKLYEQYMPIRPFIAEILNTKTKIICDIRRMPMLREEKSITFDMSKTSWFPKIDMCGPQILKSLSNSDNYFCQQIIKFTQEMKKIMFPILDFFGQDKKKGRIFNVFGEQSDFMLETVYSLKAFCGQSINYTQGSLRKRKNYKCQNSYKTNEVMCSVMLSSLQEQDVNDEVLTDIQSNIQIGYSAFASQTSNFVHSEKNQRLILIFSQKRLQFGRLKKEIKYYQIPDYQITKLKNSIDYEFLIYYSNILFNKCMIVQQNCSSRKPFYQLMICMWTYVLAVYLTGESPSLENSQSQPKLKQVDDIEIHLDLCSEDQQNFGSTDDSDFLWKQPIMQKPQKKIKINDDKDLLILSDKQKRKKFITV